MKEIPLSLSLDNHCNNLNNKYLKPIVSEIRDFQCINNQQLGLKENIDYSVYQQNDISNQHELQMEDNTEYKMDILGLTPRTHFFDIPLRLHPESSSSMQLEPEDNGDDEHQTENIFLEIGRPEQHDRIISHPISINLEDANADNNCISTDVGSCAIPQHDEPIPSHVGYESSSVKWFEDDVDLTKILLCNAEGEIEVDEFNLGFSENILFGNEEDPQQLTKDNKISSSNLQATSLELNNNYEDGNFLLSKSKPNDVVDIEVEQCDVSTIRDKIPIKSDQPSTNPFNCHHCCKSFRYSSRLKRHMTTHQNKQYPCHICHKLFSRIDVMEVHISRTHYKHQQQPQKQNEIINIIEVRTNIVFIYLYILCSGYEKFSHVQTL